jgi:hypothetical protein
MNPPRVLAVLCFLASQVFSAAADSKKLVASEAVQIDVGDALATRVITVVKGGALVPLKDDIDGAGGLATRLPPN